MTKVKALLVSFGLAALLTGAAACGSDPVKDMEGLADEMCECKDADCIKAVQTKLDGLQEKYKDLKELDSNEKSKLTGLAMRAGECLNKVMQGSGDGAAAEAPPGGAPAADPHGH